MANLTPNQIKSLVYNVIGRASETANVAFNKLVVAQTGISGYSIGALQTDFTANKAAGRDLIAQYQAWAAADKKLTAAEVNTAGDLIVQQQYGKQNGLGADIEAKLNTYLASPAGGAWVAARDDAVYQNKLKNVVQPMMASEA